MSNYKYILKIRASACFLSFSEVCRQKPFLHQCSLCCLYEEGGGLGLLFRKEG